MDLTRRDLIRSTGAAGAAVALGSLSAEAVAGVPASRTTLHHTLLKGPAGPGGYRPVVRGPGEPHVVRTGLGVRARSGRAGRRRPLLAFAQLSDVHVVDAQSPARVEFSDPNGPPVEAAYRPQELLTAHVAESMVRRLNQIGRGPVTGRPLGFALQTGDNSDNAQYNELRWNITVLDGGEVTPDSGDLTRYEGVMDGDPAHYDTYYWHPEGTPEGEQDDEPRATYGFPVVPGLLDAARRPFTAHGLAMPWFTALGNHDPLAQGNSPTNPALNAIAVGTQKTVSGGGMRTVTADPDRRFLSRAEIVEEHFTTTGAPVGHGFTDGNVADGTAYYAFDRGLLRFLVLDTVNPNGYANGSLDVTQFAWLQEQLAASTGRLVVVASHHTSDTMDNPLVGDKDPQPRVLGPQVLTELLACRRVIAWVNGHTHRNAVTAHRRGEHGGFWEINTASHVDFPQQSRLIEVADNRDGTLSIFCTMVDHAAPPSYEGRLGDPVALAALSRELGANDWQAREDDKRGRRRDRNVELLVRAPKFLR